MNKITRRFLSGASFLALSLGLPTTTVHAGIVVGPGATATVRVPDPPPAPTHPLITDYIVVTGAGTVLGDIFNDGIIIGNDTGIEIQPGGIVDGSIINEGLIFASGFGIAVDTSGFVGGKIFNTSKGNIDVVQKGIGAATTIAGIADFGTVDGGIVNSGLINVVGTGTGHVYGVLGTSTGDLFLDVHNDGGQILVVEATNNPGANVAVFADGIALTASDDMRVTVTNAGSISVTAAAKGALASASAFGVHVVNGGNADGATNNFARFFNDGNVKVSAAASGTIYAHATAEGVRLYVEGGGASHVNATFSNQPSGFLTVTAKADGPAGASALAIGMEEFAFDGDFIAKASAQNSGLIHVFASASGSNANAEARGVSQEAGAVNTLSGIATAFFNNQGKLTVTALAAGSGNAYAQGVRQAITGANDAHATLTNGGDIYVSAHGIGDIAQASALGIKQDVTANSWGNAKFHNSGNLTVLASAVGFTSAKAKATGVIQNIDPATAVAKFTNTSLASFKVTATANATTKATATANGVKQHITATWAGSEFVVNSGLIQIAAVANASNTTAPAATATANAFVSYGIQQFAKLSGVIGIEHVSNLGTGVIDVSANAFASATWVANANAKISAGITQSIVQTGVGVESGSVLVVNQGTINIHAHASAKSAETANAKATITRGIIQHVSASETAHAIIRNSGEINITAHANAAGTSANAFASVGYGIAQYAHATTTSAAAHVTLTNQDSIDIKALASANAGVTAIATAHILFGITQYASGGSFAQAKLTNAGTISILAHAKASGVSAYDVAKITTGFYQYANAGGGDAAFVALDNSSAGNITVRASAEALGDNQASAWGTLNYGIAQYAISADHVSAHLTNNGNIHLSALAHATATSGSAKAFADMVFGVWQSANADGNSGTFAKAEIFNTGVLGVKVSAKATASGSVAAHAQLSDWGIFQLATNAGSANVTLDNSGDINILAHAYAKGDALATAIIGTIGGGNATAGILQYAAGSNVASVSLSNHSGGKIGVIARAAAIDTVPGGVATANAWNEGAGIRQIATSANQAEVKLANTSGTIAIEALALASALSGTANASAFILTGIYQRAASTGTDVTFAKDVLTNDGTLDIIAQATAKGGSLATASAFISAGISQGAFGGDTANASLENNGQLNIWALAKATADNANANAGMSVFFGIFQHAVAGDDNLVASVKLTNGADGTIQILDRATANGETHAFAHADLHSGIVQYASGAESVAAFLSNAGDIFITAKAHASATSGSASAYAFMVAGVFQHASADGNTSANAVASLINSGDLDVEVRATANASNNANALAHATLGGWGIYQQATNAGYAHAGIDNSGDIEIIAHAHAQGGSGAITALAIIGNTSAADGIFQSASALTGNFTASVDLTNEASGKIDIIAQASAVSESAGGGNAKASALINEYGIHQVAGGAEDEDIKLDNSGLINIAADAYAHATWTGGGASAHAFIHEGISQHAVVSGGGSANISLTNAKSANINIIASAHAQGADNNGKAVATVSYGISQYAQSAGSAALKINNGGTIVIAAIANVDGGWNDSGYASAGIAAGIDQSASAGFGGQTKAVAALTNSGKITIEAFAHATGDTNATAIAAIGQGIIQFAHGGDSASVALKNTGTINIEALAHASGDAKASAQINYGIEQQAFAGNNQNSATAQITNGVGALLNIIAAATATGGVATATATISHNGIYQHAYSAGVAKALITNAGTINIEAKALANATIGVAKAYAVIASTAGNTGTGIFQSARAIGSTFLKYGTAADVLIDNSGKILIEAVAGASGPGGATATASVLHGIDQFALNGNVVSAKITGAGTVSILAHASANASTGDAIANAKILTGIDQAAGGSFGALSTAYASISIGGGLIEAYAKAVGDTANAIASITQFGIYQNAPDGIIDHISFINNSGDFLIGAVAIAQADVSSANAKAYVAHGIHQDGFGVGGFGATVDAHISNKAGATLSIVANAKATGLKGASAAASNPYPIFQQVGGGLDDSVTLDNSGIVNIAAIAYAKATTGEADAHAYIHTGVFQQAQANGSATASLVNAGKFAIIASAFASGTTGVTAVASITDYGIYQAATGAGNAGVADVVLKNTGTLDIEALAHAKGDALASAYISTGIYQTAKAFPGSITALAQITNGLTVLGGPAQLNIIAAATATGGVATANATISNYGIYQHAFKADVAKALITNAGTIAIEAKALANATTGVAQAFAVIGTTQFNFGTGIFQSAVASNNNLTASAIIDNSGKIAIEALATANGATGASATAKVLWGITQHAKSAGVAHAELVGGGDVTIAAIAHASAKTGPANALATIYTGINQSANAGAGGSTSAIASIGIGGGGIIASATAKGDVANASASITNYGIYQLATNGKTDIAKMDVAGDFAIAAFAKAFADTGKASAYATIQTGIYQTAKANGGASDLAKASIAVGAGGALNIVAGATASGAAGATPSATIAGYGIYQHAQNAPTVSALIHNSGDLNIAALAKGVATSGNADAHATLGNIGIYQTAEALGGTGNHALASIYNGTGAINVVASAFASGTSGATATAKLNNYGVYQHAWNAATASALIHNSGDLNVAALAKAIATSGNALAHATLGSYGIYQQAEAIGGAGNQALASIDNGTGAINVVASAFASGEAGAVATAKLNSYGIYQDVFNAGQVSALIGNSGDINVAALAKAIATSGSAVAHATLGNIGIYQLAQTQFFGGNHALASINNGTGAINVVASAFASGTAGATATAKLNNYGIFQHAFDANHVSALIGNSGDINVAALAKAVAHSGSAIAHATLNNYGIFQSAQGTNKGLGSIENGTGAINVVASAFASGEAGAVATGKLNSYGIYQDVFNAGQVSALIGNSGDINVAALAKAIATSDSAVAHATLGSYGIFQLAFADFGGAPNKALASIDNGTGAINVVASAFASGTSGANAAAKLANYGIYQDVFAAGQVSALIGNSGDINVAALAKAIATSGSAAAHATLGNYGIYQFAVALGGATNKAIASIDNGTGAINVVASAFASGAFGATATGKLNNYGIYQNVFGAGQVSALIGNSGDINVAALAKALAFSGNAHAHATLNSYGIVQHPNALGGATNKAIASIDNGTGAINVVASAFASASWAGGASATAKLVNYGIYQDVSAAGQVSALIGNSGDINVAALAKAVAHSGNAVAHATLNNYGIFQFADAVGGATNKAIASIANGEGAINVVASAFASAPWQGSAKATALLNNYGIYQDVFGAGQVSALIGNSGDINVAALAHAVASSANAVARATLKNYGIYQFADALGGATNKAIASIDNGTGAINVVASAVARVDWAGSASATALLNNYGIYQEAIGAGQVSALIGNSGDINVAALAKALADSGTAVAHATLNNYGIYQYADALGGAANQALASIDNGTGALNVVASASANGWNGASATAVLKDRGVYQDVFGAGQVSALIGNSGTFNVAAIARAGAESGSALANATINGAGIYQYGSAIGGATNNALASIDNDGGNFNVVASAFASATSGQAVAHASITAYGIYQHAGGAGTAQAVIHNSGAINIAALAHAIGDVTATAFINTGIYQTAVGITKATAQITNVPATALATAKINIIAQATATGGGATAKGTISGYGIYEKAAGASNVLAAITNVGTINIVAGAKASATNGAANAFAGIASAGQLSGTGIYQTAVAGNGQIEAEALIDNSGKIFIEAAATAFGSTNASATAYVLWGISQYAKSAGIAEAKLTGAGTVVIAALASATASNGFASGYAKIDTGIHQSANANAGAHTSAVAAIDVANLAIIASGYGKGADASAHAYINTYGIYQKATNGDIADVSLKNSGGVEIAALAKATGSITSATAYAYIDYGIYQYANAADDRLTAAAVITNSGTMAIVASALASGEDHASATGYLYYGIRQYAYGAEQASAIIHGEGVLDIAAIASAKAASGFASGYAFMYTGIYQTANASYANHTSALASISVASGGIDAIGKAKGTSASAKAYISDYGIYQKATGGDVANVRFANTGVFDIAAIADATATSKSAYAYAYIDYGIYQYAHADNGNVAANATIANAGTLAIVASAHASGVTKASATAYNYYGIRQYAYGAEQGSVKITGDGILDIAAIASATAAKGFASGYALIKTGIYQYATAINGSQSNAIASISVDGGGILALANAKGTSASASAYIQYYGIEQHAYYGDVAYVSLKNTGVFDIAAIAHATASVKSASAYAYIDYGVYQYASAGDDKVRAADAITNGSGTFAVIASAKASGATNAKAYAYNYYPIEQLAYYGEESTATLDNESGVVAIEAVAKAKAAAGTAHAYAYMSTGLYQYAKATVTAGANALDQITNGGTMAIVAQASATGTKKVTASAYISNYGIYQSALGGDTVKAEINNSGTLAIAALAHASGDAFAYAYIGTGIYQSAFATNNQVAATVAIGNTSLGAINIVADATAIAAVGNATASAYLSDYGIYQHAHSADKALASIDNAGGALAIFVKAAATAVTGTAHAYAILGTTLFNSGTGIYQSASVTGNQINAEALIDNSGSIDVVADAIAHGAKAATATAYVLWGISQYAFNGATDSAKLVGGGTVQIAAIASALADAGPAKAYASIITGIYQSATATTKALASIDVGGGGVAAIADAKGSVAKASAFIQTYGVYQFASATTADVNFKNSGGAFEVVAAAKATATVGAAAALASIAGAGIYQYAYATSSVAAIKLTNSATLGVVAAATAKGVTGAVASAYISYGITQYADDGGLDSARLKNSGVLNVAALASASATKGPATAHASMTSGIYQYVSAWYGGHTSAEALLTNSAPGTMAIVAQAKAKGTTASAKASITEYGIYQYAIYGNTDNVGLKNSGVLDIAAIANATANAKSAFAYAYIDYGIYQEAYASYASSAASVKLTNDGGTLAIIASANASGVTNARATAYNYYGIEQYANDAGLANADLENSGEFDIVAHASAAAAKGAAHAYAFMYTGIYQDATAYYGSHTSAVVTLTNAKTMNIVAAAHASGKAATASAYINDYGIYQYANYGDTDTANLRNSGTLEIAAIANATAANAANAVAYVDTGIYQFASASYASNTAAVNLTNDTGGKLDVLAIANASGNTVNAKATIVTGIAQSALGADGVFAYLSNHGTMDVAAAAIAKGDATAHAQIGNGIAQLASNTINHPTAVASLINANKLFVSAFASAVDTGKGIANATALITSHGVFQQAFNGATDSVVLKNSGTLGVNVVANAKGGDVFALALIEVGVGQLANGVTGGSAIAEITNAASAKLVVAAVASAVGGPTATATAFITHGILQVVSGVKTATADLVNSGLLEVAAAAQASGGSAIVRGVVIAAGQTVIASHAAFGTMVNAGTFIVMAAGVAHGGALGSASAFASGGPQIVSAPGTAVGSIVNSGTFEALAHASATGNKAYAKAIGLGPQQTVTGGKANALVVNSGTFIAQGVATAIGGASALASGFASGISQSVAGAGVALAEIENDSLFVVNAAAKAVAHAASAVVEARGVYQSAHSAGGGATVSFVNNNTMLVHAQATASGIASGIAFAKAAGDIQVLTSGGSVVLHNNDLWMVTAEANAGGATASAVAFAKGDLIIGGTSMALALDVVNDGVFRVLASANDAIANAAGVLVTYTGTGAGGKVSGTIENHATMLVEAKAPSGSANALGIGVFASQFNGGIFNDGILQAYAIGSTAAATAIKIGNGGATGATGTGTIDNDGGTIWAGVSTDGKVVLRGTAIDVSGAPNAIVINLEGNTQDGVVFGNIKLSANNDDTINVVNGKTVFDGGINPDGDQFGTLNVGGGTAPGTLEFVHNPVEGQAYAYVHSYNQAADGTISFHVDPNPDPNFVFIHADNATLDGTIQMDFVQGLYADTTVWRIVLSTDPISGTWDNLVSNFHSLFLTPEARYTTFEADIVLNRAPFTQFCQDTKNKKAVTGGLENAYSPSLTGPFADLVHGLLYLQTEDEFCQAVDQLSGVEIGQTARSNLDAAEILKDAVAAHLQAIWGGNEQLTEMRSSVEPAAGSAMGRVSVWGGAFGNWGSTDRTKSGPGFDSNFSGLVGGADLRVAANTLLGVAGSWTASGHDNFDNGNDGNFDGYQIGLYGRYNGDALYLQGLAAFGSYSNDTRRFVSIPNFGAGNIKGSFNNDVWQLYGEGGYHVATNSRIDLIPYVALHYLRGDAGAYTETGLPGANLHVSNITTTSFSSYLGARVSLDDVSTGGTRIVPTFKLAWQHEFEDTAWSVDAAFAGAPLSAFTVTGQGLARDSLIAGGELAISWGGNIDAVIDYEGRFNSDHQSNSLIGRLNFKL